jgi:Family of unknown function (DUF6941)
VTPAARLGGVASLSLRTLLLCDHALTGQDGKISAIGIFGQINVARLPAVHPRLFIVAIMDAQPGTHELTLQVISPRGTPLLQQQPQLHMEVPDGTTTANIVADLNGLEVRELGRHEVELREGDRLLGSAPLSVNLMYQPGGVARA